MNKMLGIVGGVGPLATMLLGELIVRHTKADKDQQHVHMMIDNDTTIPDRTAYIVDSTKENPIPYLVRDVKKLTNYGAEVICIPCNTAHTFYEEMQGATDASVLHMIEETAKVASVHKRVGILATDGTIASGIYQQALRAHGIEPVVPDETTQQRVMSLIYDYVKAGRDVELADWAPIAQAMAHCDRIILGCTELSIIHKDLRLGEAYIDSLTVLAKAAIVACGYEVKTMHYQA